MYISIIIAILLSAIATSRLLPGRVPPLDIPPAQVVRLYYTYISQGNIHNAVEFVTPKVSAQESLPGGDFNNVARL